MTEPRTFSRFWGKRCLGYFSWRRRRRFIHNPKVLDLITELVLSEAPDLVAITGDLVQLGSVEEIKEAASWLRQLSKETKVFVVPGNHDVYVKSSVKLIREFWGPYIHLVDNSFRIGDVILKGIRLNVPCKYLEEITGKSVYGPLVHRSGLNCEILKTGIVHCGDLITPI